MKNRERFLILLATWMMAGLTIYGQCTPDPECVDDDGRPGQFCPMDLPDGAINVLYDETVTIIPPGSFDVPDIGIVNINFIMIDTVENLPLGIEYFPNADTLYPDNSYCIQLTGTPTELGKDTLTINIIANVDLLGGLDVPVVDDTSLVITIKETVGIDPMAGSDFQVFQNVPNPFSEHTRLDYYMPFRGEIELKVYNLQGVLVHHESEVVPTGDHHFGFDGRGLPPGTYLYRVKNSKGSISGKLIKTN